MRKGVADEVAALALRNGQGPPEDYFAHPPGGPLFFWDEGGEAQERHWWQFSLEEIADMASRYRHRAGWVVVFLEDHLSERVSDRVPVTVVPLLFKYDPLKPWNGQYQDRLQRVRVAIASGDLHPDPSDTVGVREVVTWTAKEAKWEPADWVGVGPVREFPSREALKEATYARFYKLGAPEGGASQGRVHKWVESQSILGIRVGRDGARAIVREVAPADRTKPGLKR